MGWNTIKWMTMMRKAGAKKAYLQGIVSVCIINDYVKYKYKLTKNPHHLA
jgi:hypothetical protein